MGENNSSLDDINEEKEKVQEISSDKPKKDLIEELKEELKKELKEELKEELKDELKEETKEELKEELKEESKEESKKENEKTEAIETPATKVNLPTQPVEIVKLTKSGSITIPKKLREKLAENQMFACWEQDFRIIFQPIQEFQIPELNIVKIKSSAAKDPSKKSKGSKRIKKIKKKTGGPQPELIKYIPFQIDNQDKILSILESTFYLLTEEPSKIEEGIDRIRYIIINYTSGVARNDDRLKNTVILFISDIIEKIPNQNFNELIIFAQESIVSSIKSKFLREQGLITLFVTSIRANSEGTELFLKEILQGISEYTEPYAILQGFKGLVRSISKSELDISDALKFLIRDEIQKFIFGYEQPKKEIIQKEEAKVTDEETEISDEEIEDLSDEEIEDLSDEELKELLEEEEIEIPKEVIEEVVEKEIEQLNTDHSLQLIELLEEMHLIEDAYTLTENLLRNISPEDIRIDAVRQALSRIKKTHI